MRYEPWWFGCTGAAIAADGVDFDDWSQQVLSPTPPGKVLLSVSLPGGYFRMFLGFTSSGGTVEPAELAEGTVFSALMCSDSAEQEERT